MQLQWRTLQDIRPHPPQTPRRVWHGIGYPPPHWENGLGRGLCPFPRKFFVFFVENTIFGRILTRSFLKSYANGRGSNPPNPLLGTPLCNSRRGLAARHVCCYSCKLGPWTVRTVAHDRLRARRRASRLVILIFWSRVKELTRSLSTEQARS